MFTDNRGAALDQPAPTPPPARHRLLPSLAALATALVAVTLLPVTIPGPAPALAGERTPVKIGLLLPPTEVEAQNILRGAQLGVEFANREPGRPVELIVRGQPGQWGTEGNEAVVLALDDGVEAIIAPTAGTAAHQVLQVAGRTRKPVVSLCPDSSVTGPRIPWTIRIAPRTDEEAVAIFAAVRKAGQPLRVAALIPTDRAGRETAKDLQTAAIAAKVELAAPIETKASAAPGPLIERLLTGKPDLVLLWLDAFEAGRFAAALRQAGFTGRLAGPARALAPAFTAGVLATIAQPANAGTIAGDVLFPRPLAASQPNQLRDRYTREWIDRWLMPGGALAPVDATNQSHGFTAALACDAVRLLADVLRRAGDKPAFTQFPLTTSLPGVTGDITFDRDGNRLLPLEAISLRDGHIVLLPTKPDGQP